MGKYKFKLQIRYEQIVGNMLFCSWESLVGVLILTRIPSK